MKWWIIKALVKLTHSWAWMRWTGLRVCYDTRMTRRTQQRAREIRALLEDKGWRVGAAFADGYGGFTIHATDNLQTLVITVGGENQAMRTSFLRYGTLRAMVAALPESGMGHD